MIPVNEPLFVGNEKKYLNECIDTAFISSEGPFVQRFERSFAEYIGHKHGIAVCNGTASVETALYAIGVGYGDEVILPSFTIISCVLAILRLGAVPVLVDIDPYNWCMDTSQVENKITKKTKAIMAVHIYGHSVDMDPLLQIRDKYGIKIIEDAAESHGAEYYSKSQKKWIKCGAIGDVASTSFYANKIIATGEGGMVLCSDDRYADRARAYRNLCFDSIERFDHKELGYNFRMTNLQAAVGLAQVEKIDFYVDKKIEIGSRYRELLKDVDCIRFMPIYDWAKSVYWMNAVELNPSIGVDAKVVMKKLGEKGIATRPFFKGMHDQPILNKMGYFHDEKYPNTDFGYKYGFYLPSGMALTDEKIEKVTHEFKKVLAEVQS